MLSGEPMTNEAQNFAEARAALIAEIEAEVQETRNYLGKDRLDPAVLAAIAKVPREEFVPAVVRDLAYINRPHAIGHGQTISQPYIVAVMTDMLAPAPGARVLEIGTGCGYQAAVLSEIADEVYTIEVVASLAEAARARLERLGYANIRFRIGDGRAGWPECAPYDGIMVTAATPRIPGVLVDQLKTGGRLVIPVGRQYGTQLLTRVDKGADGSLSETATLPVAFVPLVEKD
jgi:protein-L-isoaspartate(D-aspartate) O-methyltransferase